MDKETIDFFKTYEFPEKSQKKENIFDTGLFKMYENPFTEILKYIIDQDSPYKNKILFIKYLIFGLTEDKKITSSFCNKLIVEKQSITKYGKYIDMLIYNDKYVLALENKIEHIPNNPFKIYKNYVKKIFPNHKYLFFIFSLHECKKIKDWKNVLIGNIFSNIKIHLSNNCNNKWDYFVIDFLNHYIKEKRKMTNKELIFCKKYFSKFMEGRNLLNDYINEIHNQLNKSFKLNKTKDYVEKDEGTIWFQLYPYKSNYPMLEFCLYYDNFYYLYFNHETKTEKIKKDLIRIVGEQYENKINKKGIIIFSKKNDEGIPSLKKLFNEIETHLKIIKNIYKKK